MPSSASLLIFGSNTSSLMWDITANFSSGYLSIGHFPTRQNNIWAKPTNVSQIINKQPFANYPNYDNQVKK